MRLYISCALKWETRAVLAGELQSRKDAMSQEREKSETEQFCCCIVYIYIKCTVFPSFPLVGLVVEPDVSGKNKL